MALPARLISPLLVCALAGPATAEERTFSVPATWRAAAPRPMRTATWLLPPTAGDPGGAECAVYFFGPGLGGSVEANLDNWVRQFDAAQPSAPSQTKTHGWTVTKVEVEGTLRGAEPHSGYKLLGAIVQGAQGSYFVKLLGPRRTVSEAHRDFARVVSGITG